MPLSYEQAKDQIAKKEGHANWKILEYRMGPSEVEICLSEAAELYADSVAREAWDRACEAAEQETKKFGIDYIRPEYQPK